MDISLNNGKSDVEDGRAIVLLENRDEVTKDENICPKWTEEQEHDFEEEMYLKITSCEFSGSLFPPFTKGLRCTRCSFDCKPEHADSVLPNCNYEYNSRTTNEDFLIEHDFYEKHFSSTAFCNVCRKLMKGVVKQGWACQGCGYAAHEKCLPMAPSCCPPNAFSNAGPLRHRHFWIEGNLTGSCYECEKKLKSKSKLFGYKCYYCHRQFCPSCLPLSKYYEACDLGAYAAYKIHPSSIITHGSMDKSHWEVNLHEGCVPLFVFINKKSGGQLGQWIIRRFNKILNPYQVVDLRDGEPNHTLEMLFRLNIKYKVLACGGDGTAAWILSALDTIRERDPDAYIPPLAILPLGTGNDLARTLGWGGGYDKESIEGIVQCLELGSEVFIDRWAIKITSEDADDRRLILNNYFSIGIDAKIALDFHLAREKNPKKFKSRTINKMYYAQYGALSMISGTPEIPKKITLFVDDVEIAIPSNLEGVMVLNLPSWAGGKNPWGSHSEEWQPQSVSDKLVEVIGLKGSFHMGRIQGNISDGIKLAQGSKVVFEWVDETELPVQLDGEPWMNGKCRIEIEHYTQSKMIMNKEQSIIEEDSESDDLQEIDNNVEILCDESE